MMMWYAMMSLLLMWQCWQRYEEKVIVLVGDTEWLCHQSLDEFIFNDFFLEKNVKKNKLIFYKIKINLSTSLTNF